MEKETTIGDVLSGNAPLKFEIAMDYKTIAVLALGIFIAVVGAIFITRK